MNDYLSGLPDPDLDKQFYSGVPLKRFLAWLIDAIIVVVMSFVIVILTFGIAAFFWFLVAPVISFGYRSYMLHRSSATLGMKVMGIELRNARGDKLDGAQVVWHVVLYLFLISIFIFGLISAVMILLNRRGQGLHDTFLGIAAINTPDE